MKTTVFSVLAAVVILAVAGCAPTAPIQQTSIQSSSSFFQIERKPAEVEILYSWPKTDYERCNVGWLKKSVAEANYGKGARAFFLSETKTGQSQVYASSSENFQNYRLGNNGDPFSEECHMAPFATLPGGDRLNFILTDRYGGEKRE